MSRAAVSSLRLVDSLPAAVLAAPARDVARANRVSAKLAPLTAQALFAADVTGSLEGGRAAALPLDKRRRLVASAVRLGIKEFDAHLIIAMVQDRARGGGPDGRAADSSVVRAGSAPEIRTVIRILVAALALGAVLLGVLIALVG